METNRTRDNPVILMQCVLVDTCGWVAVIEANLNIDKSLIECVGINQLAILPRVLEELEAIEGVNLMLPMLRKKSIFFDTPNNSGKHTDDQLFVVASENKFPILTVDTELKRRLSKANLPWIEVIGGTHLRYVR